MKLWKLSCSVEVCAEDTTSVSGDKYEYVPCAVEIRERHGPPYVTEYSVIHPEEHGNKPPSSTRKSQSPDFQILTAFQFSKQHEEERSSKGHQHERVSHRVDKAQPSTNQRYGQDSILKRLSV